MPENWDRANLYEGALIGYAVGSSAATEDKDKADLLIELAEMQRKVDSLESENASLRGAVTGLGDECDRLRSYIERKKLLQDFARLMDENAKLRELARHALLNVMTIGWCDMANLSATLAGDQELTPCDSCCFFDTDCCTFVIEEHAEELGIEVN